MERDCKSCSDLVSQKKIYSTDINMLKKLPPNEKHQMLHYNIGEYEPRQNIIDFEYAREILMKEDDKMVVKRRSERIYNMMEHKSYNKHEDVPGNKEIFINGFKHTKTDKIDKNIVIGCKSDELYEIEYLFNFWSKKFINKEIEMRKFEIKGWSLMTLVKKKQIF